MKILLAASKSYKLKGLSLNYQVSTYQKNCLNITEELLSQINKKSKNELAEKMKLKNKLLDSTYDLYHSRDILDEVEAISYYNGFVFKQLEDYSQHLDYLNENIILISALYGLLKPFDKIKPYRLDFNMKLFDKSLYQYWTNLDSLITDEVIVNLASNEYSKVINKDMINIQFRQIKEGKLKNMSTYTKMARGMFLNYLIQNEIDKVEDFKKFAIDGYRFIEEKSDSKNLYFIKELG